MSEEDNGENLKGETSHEDENEQKVEELGSTESNEEREPVPVTRKRPEPKAPSQSAGTEMPTAETSKVCVCVQFE